MNCVLSSDACGFLNGFFKDRRLSSVEEIWIISPDQALLDCAGLGYAGRDFTLKLVDIYDLL